jgi:pimeloyl-ACP methyl ester carboxylesterase
MSTVGQRTVTTPTTANTSLGPLKQIDAGVLNVGSAEAGPVNGPTVLLLHGWPYDIQSFVDVAPRLASAGYRVIVPYLRGYGTTSFLSNETFRNGQPSALALDAIALMDALKIDRAIVAGFDWGARHRRRPLATALQGARIREWLPDRQPGGEQEAVATGG